MKESYAKIIKTNGITNYILCKNKAVLDCICNRNNHLERR